MNVFLKVDGLDKLAILWRYMDIAKFVSMLEQKAIWLARADTFWDKHEGRFPIEMRECIDKAYKDFDDNGNSPVKDPNDFQDYLVKNTFISCWHHNLEENMVMWGIYGGSTKAVAIQTTVDDIVRNADPSSLSGHSLNFKDVVYRDADEILGVLRYEDCFFRKRRHFSFEKEVRISLDTYSVRNPTKDTPPGYKLPAFLSGMINKVVVHPDSPEWFFDAVDSITKRYELHAPVERGSCGNT